MNAYKERKMKKLSWSIVSSIALLSLITSCGNDSSSSKSNQNPEATTRQEEVAPPDGSNIDGLYKAKFITINPHVNGTIPGSATFYRKDDRFMAYVRLFAGGPRAWHQQFVFEGSRCPDKNDDLNQDGFIDIEEAEKVLGRILIPLDSDISSQNSGRRFFPLGDLSGYYHYERATSFRRFLADLQSEDRDPDDNMMKLAPDEGLRIIGRTVMVLGVSETVQLPETVATKERRRAFQTLPIACGVFEKVDELPGDEYSDEIPGPVAEVEEGQDRPAEEEIPEPTTGGSTSGSTTGSTNDSDDGHGPTSDGNGRTTGGTTGGSTTGSTTSGGSGTDTTTTGGATSGSSNSGGSTSGSSSSGSSTSGGSTTSGGSSSGDSSSSSSSSSSTTGSSSTGTGSNTSTSSSSTSSSSSSGTSTGGFLDSSSGI
jgi:hypothetical protein